jgi:hypothetical protein
VGCPVFSSDPAVCRGYILLFYFRGSLSPCALKSISYSPLPAPWLVSLTFTHVNFFILVTALLAELVYDRLELKGFRDRGHT